MPFACALRRVKDVRGVFVGHAISAEKIRPYDVLQLIPPSRKDLFDPQDPR